MKIHTRIYTGLLIEKYYIPKKIKNKIINTDFDKVFTENEVFDIIREFKSIEKSYKDLEKDFNELDNRIANNEKISEENTEFIGQTIHEIRRLNAAIKRQSEEAARSFSKDGARDNDFVKYRIDNIFATASLISSRLNAYDFSVNPNLAITQKRNYLSPYRKFEKVRHCLQSLFSRKNISMEFNGNSYSHIYANEIFELLPFLLLENCLKYTPNNQTVTVSFLDNPNTFEITIENIGPSLKSEEKSDVFQKNIRGKLARDKYRHGSGFGLYYAKNICDLHSIDISIEKDVIGKISLDGIDHEMFKISLKFNEYLYYENSSKDK
jgi:signal transduction histidine kinase